MAMFFTDAVARGTAFPLAVLGPFGLADMVLAKMTPGSGRLRASLPIP
jgi:hypothetical protein